MDDNSKGGLTQFWELLMAIPCVPGWHIIGVPMAGVISGNTYFLGDYIYVSCFIINPFSGLLISVPIWLVIFGPELRIFLLLSNCAFAKKNEAKGPF